MTKPNKAYIIRISDPLSQEYAKTAANSCEKIGLPYEFIEGVTPETFEDDYAKLVGIRMRGNGKQKGYCATASHFKTWQKMVQDNVPCSVILEHDALMLYEPPEIPDNMIVALGYKCFDPENYNHKEAGPPKDIRNIDGHAGAHAYAITISTAKSLLTELKNNFAYSMVDNTYFLKGRKTSVPIGITDPTCAIGWLRESTIWNKSDSTQYHFIDSFKNNYSGNTRTI